MQNMMLRASVSLLPSWVRQRLNLGSDWRLKSWERVLLKRLGAAFDHLPVSGTPPVQACKRLGLKPAHLYGRR
jgi:uncharacterized protein (DUF2236 family)